MFPRRTEKAAAKQRAERLAFHQRSGFRNIADLCCLFEFLRRCIGSEQIHSRAGKAFGLFFPASKKSQTIRTNARPGACGHGGAVRMGPQSSRAAARGNNPRGNLGRDSPPQPPLQPAAAPPAEKPSLAEPSAAAAFEEMSARASALARALQSLDLGRATRASVDGSIA